MFVKIDHINITVTSLEESADWYGKTFGFHLVEAGKSMLGNKYAILSKNDFALCMTEYPKRKSADEADDKSIHKIYHFGLRIADAEAWRKHLKDNKIKLNYGGEVDYPHSKSWYINDPSGHEIEVTYSPDKELVYDPM